MLNIFLGWFYLCLLNSVMNVHHKYQKIRNFPESLNPQVLSDYEKGPV